MARKKAAPAELRTVDMFTGKTRLEEANDQVLEELQEVRDPAPRDIVAEAEECVIRWLGLDAFHEGDDIRVAVHKKGHAVLMLVNTYGAANNPYATMTIKLTKTQWDKLKELCKET